MKTGIRSTRWNASTRSMMMCGYLVEKCWVSSSSSLSTSFRPAAGSSRSRNRGEPERARARPSLRWSPYGSSSASRPAERASPIRSSSSVARARAARRRAPAPSAAASTFSCTVSRANERMPWNDLATPASENRRGCQFVASSPSTSTLPAVGRWKPVIAFRSVVLPAPFGPITPRIVPSGSSRSTPSTALTPTKWTARPRVLRVGRAAAGWAVRSSDEVRTAPRSGPAGFSTEPSAPSSG